jgi:hypothetical protein
MRITVVNMQSRNLLIAATAYFVVLLTGCAATQPIPEVTQPQSSAVAIDVLVKPPMGIGNREPVQVYFVRIDGADGLMQQSIIRSNYVKDSRAYLLNAGPGTYVAVASMFLSPGVQRGTYITYFPRDVLEYTRITVRDGEVAFMGAFVLGTSVGLDGADEVQTHYKNVIAPGQATGLLAMSFSGAVHYRGALLERKVDEQTRRAFSQKAKDDLAGSGWVPLIK